MVPARPGRRAGATTGDERSSRVDGGRDGCSSNGCAFPIPYRNIIFYGISLSAPSHHALATGNPIIDMLIAMAVPLIFKMIIDYGSRASAGGMGSIWALLSTYHTRNIEHKIVQTSWGGTFNQVFAAASMIPSDRAVPSGLCDTAACYGSAIPPPHPALSHRIASDPIQPPSTSTLSHLQPGS